MLHCRDQLWHDGCSERLELLAQEQRHTLQIVHNLLLFPQVLALATAGLAIFGLGAIRASREPGLGALSFASAAMLACINGLAPASDLILLHPPAAQLAPILAGHDLGGFAAAMTVAGAAMGLIWLAGRRLRSWRNIGSELGGAALIGLGLFWFVSRLYS